MVRLYTRTGDMGTTGLMGGPRVAKDHLRVAALGDVDEANAAIGLALVHPLDPKVRAVLMEAQNTLFTVGAQVAAPPDAKARIPELTTAKVDAIEAAMETIDVGEVREFIVPRGPPAVAALHYARTVVRRAERTCVTLNRKTKISPHVLRYLNRLSSYLFQAAVWELRRGKDAEEHPTYGDRR